MSLLALAASVVDLVKVVVAGVVVAVVAAAAAFRSIILHLFFSVAAKASIVQHCLRSIRIYI